MTVRTRPSGSCPIRNAGQPGGTCSVPRPQLNEGPVRTRRVSRRTGWSMGCAKGSCLVAFVGECARMQLRPVERCQFHRHVAIGIPGPSAGQHRACLGGRRWTQQRPRLLGLSCLAIRAGPIHAPRCGPPVENEPTLPGPKIAPTPPAPTGRASVVPPVDSFEVSPCATSAAGSSGHGIGAGPEAHRRETGPDSGLRRSRADTNRREAAARLIERLGFVAGQASDLRDLVHAMSPKTTSCETMAAGCATT